MTAFHFCLNTLAVASPDVSDLAIRGSGLGVGVKFRLPVASFSGVGFVNFQISSCCGKTFYRECGVSCFVYAMERGTERTTTGVASGGAVDG